MIPSASHIARAVLIAGLAAAPVTAVAGDTLEKRLSVDSAAEKIEAERQIVDIVRQEYGRTAVVNTGTGLPSAIDDQIAQGAILPQAAPVSPLPAKLEGKLPSITEGARWVGVGKHLVELGPDRRIETVIYHALP